jgi:hypothetical protein
MNPPPTDSNLVEIPWYLSTPVSREETMLALVTLLFTTITLGFAAFLLRHQREYSTSDIVRVFGLILIIGGTLFLMSAGFEARQVTGAIGLLGAIAGYILGKSDSPRTSDTANGKDESK